MSVVTVAEAVDFLNGVLADDREALTALMEARVPCNETLRDHPTVQVTPETTVGLLGLLNGLFGVDLSNQGYIAATYDDDGNLVRFDVRLGL